ncbi:MAG: hypothetical protein WB421_06635 [Terriglobales bacterium]
MASLVNIHVIENKSLFMCEDRTHRLHDLHDFAFDVLEEQDATTTRTCLIIVADDECDPTREARRKSVRRIAEDRIEIFVFNGHEAKRTGVGHLREKNVGRIIAREINHRVLVFLGRLSQECRRAYVPGIHFGHEEMSWENNRREALHDGEVVNMNHETCEVFGGKKKITLLLKAKGVPLLFEVPLLFGVPLLFIFLLIEIVFYL